MRAAIYTRFSTDKQDSNSTKAQRRNCEALIKREGWKLVEIYGDEGISGSDNDRPDYVRLLADSEAALFDVIVVDETSRLTRAPGELQRQLTWFKFRDQFLVDCRGFDSRATGAALLASVSGFMDEQELEKIKHRTRRGQREVVLLDFNPGGRAYGYSSEPVQTEGKRRWRVVLVPEQAKVVREIFEMYADGHGLKAIADVFNRRGVPSPGSTWNRKQRRCRGWVHTAVRAILKNERYTGKLIWNRTKWIKVPFTSKRKRVDRPRDEWVVRDIPELEIVPLALWRRVQSRFDAPSRRQQANQQKARRGRPPSHLLSGLMVCDCCGANMVIESRGRYACSSRTNGGSELCENTLRVDREIAETALLSGVQDKLLSDDALRYMKRRAREQMKAMRRQISEHDASALRTDLEVVEGKLARIADAIEQTGLSDTLADRLQSLERERVELKTAIEETTARPAPTPLPEIIPGLVETYRKLVVEIAALGKNPHTTTDDVQKARGILSGLFGQIRVRPKGDVLVATPTINAAGLIKGTAAINGSFVVAGAGFEPATFGL